MPTATTSFENDSKANTHKIPVIITDDSLINQPFDMTDDKKSELFAETSDQADADTPLDNNRNDAWNIDDCYLSSDDSDSENLINNLRDENSGHQNILMDLDNSSRSALDELNEVISGAEADLQYTDDICNQQLDPDLKDSELTWEVNVGLEVDSKESEEHQLEPEDDLKHTAKTLQDHHEKDLNYNEDDLKNVEGSLDDHLKANTDLSDLKGLLTDRLETETNLEDVEVTWEDQLEANLAFVSQIEATSDETEISKHCNSDEDVTEISDIVKPIDHSDDNQQSVQQESVQISLKKDAASLSDETQMTREQTCNEEKQDDLMCPPYSAYEFNSAVTQFEKLEEIFKHDPNVYLDDDDVALREESGNLPVITEVSESAEATETETNNDSESNDKKSSNRSSNEAIGNVVDENFIIDDLHKADDPFLDNENNSRDDSVLANFADLEILKVPAAFAEDHSHGSDTETVQIVPDAFGDSQQIEIPPGFGLDCSEAEIITGDCLNDDNMDITLEHDDILPPPIFPDSEAKTFETDGESEHISDDKIKDNILDATQKEQMEQTNKETALPRQKQFRFCTTDPEDLPPKTEANSFYSLNILQQSAESIACNVTTSQTILDQDPYKDDGYQILGADPAYLAKTQSLHKKKKKKRSDRQEDKKHPNHKSLSKSEKNLTKILRVEF